MSRHTYTVVLAHTGRTYNVALTSAKVRELRALGHSVESKCCASNRTYSGQRREAPTML